MGVGGVVEVELDRVETVVPQLCRPLAAVGARAVDVKPHAIAELAPQQAVDGHPLRLASQVPQRHLDAAEGGYAQA